MQSRDHGTDHKSINLDTKALFWKGFVIHAAWLLTPFFHRQGLLCNECVCLPGCVNGYCEDPMECICETGWQGMFCDKRKYTICNCLILNWIKKYKTFPISLVRKLDYL